MSSLKLLLIKSAAALIIGSGAVWGAYKLLHKSDSPQQIIHSKPVLEENGDNTTDTKTEAPINTPSGNANQNHALSIESEPSEISPNISNTIHDTLLSLEPNNSSKGQDNIPTTNNNRNNTNPETPKTVVPAPKSEPSVKNPGKETPNTTENFSANNILIPDVFTPYDLDGYNDCYTILIENESKFLLQIFDQGGNKVFETLDKNVCWDGKNMHTGQMSPRGYYIFKFNYELKSGYKKTERGGLNLL